MSSFVLNELEGSLFRHEGGSENAPFLKGAAKISGVEYQVSIWQNTAKSGKTWFKAKITHPDNAYQAPANLDEPLKEDDVPF